MTDISVIICSHNPRDDFLRRTLDALKAQTLPIEQWELLLIDNASKEPLAAQWDLTWHPTARHIREDELGLTTARLRGIKESTANLLAFVDDDNVLAKNYLEEIYRIAGAFPCLGCFGAGVIEPEFEVEPSEELRPYTKSLALRTVNKDQWSNSMGDSVVPWGAGLVARRAVAKRFMEIVQMCPVRKQLGRIGAELNSGEDDEISWIACELGFGKGIFPALKNIHLIDRKRVEMSYLLSIVKGHAFSHTMLAHLHGLVTYSPPAFSKLTDILSSLIRAKASTTLYHANSWWFDRHKPVLEKAFDAASRAGVELAFKKLIEMQR